MNDPNIWHSGHIISFIFSLLFKLFLFLLKTNIIIIFFQYLNNFLYIKAIILLNLYLLKKNILLYYIKLNLI